MNKEIKAQEDELEEWNAQEGLKTYLTRVLSLRPAKNMSVLSFFIFKLGKEILNAIGEDAGHICDRERYLKYFYGLKLKNLPAEEAKVLDIIIEGLEWIKEDSTLWEWKSDEHKDGISETFHGDEVFWALEFAMMTDKEIEEDADPDPLSALKNAVVWRLADGDEFLNMMEIVKVKKWCPSAQKSLECNFKDFRVF